MPRDCSVIQDRLLKKQRFSSSRLFAYAIRDLTEFQLYAHRLAYANKLPSSVQRRYEGLEIVKDLRRILGHVRISKGQMPAYFVPLWIAAIPKVRGFHCTSLNPAERILSASSSATGNRFTDSGKYLYADRWPLIAPPTAGST